jgi:hypothetical protein
VDTSFKSCRTFAARLICASGSDAVLGDEFAVGHTHGNVSTEHEIRWLADRNHRHALATLLSSVRNGLPRVVQMVVSERVVADKRLKALGESGSTRPSRTVVLCGSWRCPERDTRLRMDACVSHIK